MTKRWLILNVLGFIIACVALPFMLVWDSLKGPEHD